MSDTTPTYVLRDRDIPDAEIDTWDDQFRRTHVHGLMKESFKRIKQTNKVSLVRYMLLALVLLACNYLAHNYGDNHMSKALVRAIIAIPVCIVAWNFFGRLRTLSNFTSPQSAARFFGVRQVEDGMTHRPDADTAEQALRDLFKLKAPKSGKKRNNKTKVDPYPGVVFVPERTTMFRVSARTSAVMLSLVLIYSTGVALNMLFTILVAYLAVVTSLLRRSALRLITSLMTAAQRAGLEDFSDTADTDDDEGLDILDPRDDSESHEDDDSETEDAPAPKVKKAKKPKADKKPAASADASISEEDKALLTLLTKRHNGEPLNEFDKALLYSTFATESNIEFKDVDFPTPEAFEEMLKETASPADATPEDTDSTTPPAPEPENAPLTWQCPAGHAPTVADQTGPTGTPAHGTPVFPNNAVLSAPVPQQSSTPPAPAAATIPDNIQQMLDAYHDGWPLATEEMVLIQPYLKKWGGSDLI